MVDGELVDGPFFTIKSFCCFRHRLAYNEEVLNEPFRTRGHDCKPPTFAKPFLAWLVAQGVPLSSVSPVVITKYFTGVVAGQWNVLLNVPQRQMERQLS